jgi:Tfp pilus assembly protein PilO
VKTKNLIVIALASFFALYLWYAFIYSGMQSQASKANTAAKEAQARVATLQHQLDGSGTATNKKKPGQPDAADLNNAIPADPAESQLLRDINGVVSSSGVAWQTVQPGAPTASGQLQSMTVGITAGGTYSQLSQTVKNLLAMKRLLIVDSVAFTQSGGSGSGASGSSASGGLQLAVTARVFAQASLGTAAGAGTATTPGATPSAPAATGTGH